MRGIYATAITKLLLDSGLMVVDASPQLKGRFGNSVSERGVALVTIKDREDKRGLVVVGQRPLIEEVLGTLRSNLTRSPITVMEYELYATYLCKVVEPHRVELPGGHSGILENEAKIGEMIMAHVFTYREGLPVLRKGVALVGEYARLIEGQRHDVSEHVKGFRRDMLLSLASRAGLEGWGVKWRSASRWGEITELLDELKSLKEKAIKIKERKNKINEITKLTDGEVIAFIPLSLDDKVFLDSVRSSRVTTIPLHHFFKACGDEYSSLVDAAEGVFASSCSLQCLAQALATKLEREYPFGRLKLLHEKIDGKTIVIEGDYEILAKRPVSLKLLRHAYSNGTYNGLSVAKEAGDTIVSVVTLGSYVLPHAYFGSDGRLKGVYVNINTPIEACPPSAFWYIDLCVDVIWTKERGVELIDVDELQACTNRLAAESISYYEALANRVAEKLRSHESSLLERPLDSLKEISRSFISSGVHALLSNGAPQVKTL